MLVASRPTGAFANKGRDDTVVWPSLVTITPTALGPGPGCEPGNEAGTLGNGRRSARELKLPSADTPGEEPREACDLD